MDFKIFDKDQNSAHYLYGDVEEDGRNGDLNIRFRNGSQLLKNMIINVELFENELNVIVYEDENTEGNIVFSLPVFGEKFELT